MEIQPPSLESSYPVSPSDQIPIPQEFLDPELIDLIEQLSATPASLRDPRFLHYTSAVSSPSSDYHRYTSNYDDYFLYDLRSYHAPGTTGQQTPVTPPQWYLRLCDREEFARDLSQRLEKVRADRTFEVYRDPLEFSPVSASPSSEYLTPDSDFDSPRRQDFLDESNDWYLALRLSEQLSLHHAS